MQCLRCGNVSNETHCEFCKRPPLTTRRADEIEQRIRDIDAWIDDAAEFREKVIEQLNVLMENFPHVQELRGIKARAYSYWRAHIFSALAAEGYGSGIETSLASTVREMLEEIGVESSSQDDIFEVSANLSLDGLIEQALSEAE